MTRLFTVRVFNNFKPDFKDRLNQLTRDVDQAAQSAAIAATLKTRSSFTPKRPQNAPVRKNRSPRRMVNGLVWRNNGGDVEFDIDFADRYAKYWIIQEIGTKERATLRRGGKKNPKGKPGKSASYVRTVKPQKGRLISNALAFGTGPTGSYTQPGTASGQQLYLRSKLTGAPPPSSRVKGDQLVIGEEITGQGFVKAGSEQGFREYQTSVLAAARRAFKGKPRRP